MKMITIVLLMLLCLTNCSEKKEAIAFIALPQTEFNSSPFVLPVSVPDSLKQAHDSCMGFTFNVNAMFIKTKDTFGIGNIINKQSLKIVSNIGSLGINQSLLASQATVLTNPCYEKRVLDIPLKTLLTDSFNLSLPGASEALNKELNEAIAAPGKAEMSAGSWVYLDLRGALITILDTTQSEAGVLYKQNLLDTSNMVLTSIESVTDVSFMIATPQNMSAPLLALLQTKPSITNPETETSISLYYISDNKFQLRLNGFFPLVGQFTKAELK